MAIKRRVELLNEVHDEIRKCRECRLGKQGKPVPGEGSNKAFVVFVGEAPGRQESIEGKPFIGKAGKFLRRMITEAGFSGKESYLTNPVKYYIKGKPTVKEVRHGSMHLFKELDIIRPKVVVLLGTVACLAVLQQKYLILKEHGKVIHKNGTYFVTYHPNAPVKRELIKKDFIRLKKLAGG